MKFQLIALLWTSAFALDAHAQQVRRLVPTLDPRVPTPASVPSALPPPPVTGSDSCATAEVIPSIGGTVAYTNAGATAGPQGQATFLGGECGYGCAEYGNPQAAIPKDVWFSWTAPATGRVRITGCGSPNDTKIAVYDVPCAGIANTCVACNDDYHYGVSGLLDSAVLFTATASTNYLIQVGNSSWAPTATITGSFEIGFIEFVTTGIWDNGNIDNTLGIALAGDGTLMMQGFKAPPGPQVVTGAKVNWYPGGVPANSPVTVAIYDDPTDDQDPTDCVLLASVSGLAVPALNTFVTYTFPTPVPVSGDYFIAVSHVDVTGTEYPWSVCGETCEQHPNSSWFATRTAAAIDLGTPGNPIPSAGQTLYRLSAYCGTGFATTDRHDVWGIRADQVLQTPYSPYCAGDGTDTACPCTNPGLPGRGCQNTFGTGGATVSSTGVASISNDTLVLHAATTGAFQFGLYFEGSATANPSAPFGVGFGNGLRCVSFSGANRLEIRQADGAGSSATTVALHIPGFALAGTTYYYQLWYRDGVPPTGLGTCAVTAGFNFSNAISLTWGL